MFVFHLVPLYTICLAFATELSAPDARYNNIASDIKASIYVYHNNPEGTHNSDNQVNKTVPWYTYINVLKKASTKVLQNIRSNIKQNYFLDSNLIRLIDELFSDIGDYEYIIQSKLKKIMGRDQFNDTKEFMLDFMTLSNLLMDKMVGYNLEKIEIVSPTKWYKTLKDKIQRQEIKAAVNYVETQICKIGVCRELKFYSDYLKNWLRYLLNLKSSALREFFTHVPDTLEKHKHFIKSNIKFRKTIKNLIKADAAAQKDTLDFVDEVLINRETVYNLIPENLKKAAGLLMRLFYLIDINYDVNEENKVVLDNVTELFYNLTEGNHVDMAQLLDNIVNNMKLNLEIWALKVQSKIYFIWSEMLHL